MSQPVECRCTVPAITRHGEDICPLCGAKRHRKLHLNSSGPPAAQQKPTVPLKKPVPPIAAKSNLPQPTQPKQSPPVPNDIESIAGRHLAAVSNRGKVHPTNQDYVAVNEVDLGSYRVQVIVVCDGVSSAQNADKASKAAAEAATESLVRLLKARVDAKDAMRLSLSVADMAVRKIPYDLKAKQHPPGTTIAAVVLCKGWLTIGWIGDSRCYWIDSSGVHLLTRDHSWVNMVVDSGTISQKTAERQPEAHRIFRCIGPIFEFKSSEEQPLEVTQLRISAPGRVLVCTDGLWNYLPAPDSLTSMINFGTGSPDAVSQARSLINFANDKGGKDNISAAILAVY
jgi:PPM family protein phosphatase